MPTVIYVVPGEVGVVALTAVGPEKGLLNTHQVDRWTQRPQPDKRNPNVLAASLVNIGTNMDNPIVAFVLVENTKMSWVRETVRIVVHAE